jgi:hypothetical protein
MKTTRILAVALCLELLTGCMTTTTTRPLDGGGTETVTSKGLSDRAAGLGLRVGDRLLDRYLGPDLERGSK